MKQRIIVCFEPCCVYCGVTDDLADDQEIDARKWFHMVRPICGQCKCKGKSVDLSKKTKI